MAYFNLQMFAADGHLNFDTKLDEKGFTGGVKKLGSIAKGGLAILGGAVAGVTSVMGAGVAAGMKYNADMQNYMSNFSTMLGSQESAVKFVDQLKATAAKTPFEMSDLADASKTLLAFGSTADNANGQISMLGDISLGSSEKLKTLSTAFGRIQSNGRASMEEINMMIDSGFNPLNIIAGKTGESMDELRDRVSKGGVSFEELNEAMVQATSEGGQFYKGMEKASQTFDGLISTLKDNAMALLGEVVQPITEEMTNVLLPAAIDTIDQLSGAFQEGGVEGLVDAGASIVADLVTGIVEQLPAIIEMAIGFIDTLITALDENMPQLLEAGGRLLLALIQGVMTLIPSIASLGWSIISGLIEGITANSGQLESQGSILIDRIASGISMGLPKLVQDGFNAIAQFVQGLLSNLPAVISSAGQIINRLLDAILTALPQLLSSGVKLIGELAQGLLNNLPAIVSAIASVIAELLATIVSHLPELLQKGIELIGELAAGLIEAIPKVAEAVPQIIDSIKEKFTEIDWGEVGRNIIDGIVTGLKNAASRLVEAAAEAATDALDWVKEKLGIHSPSTVWRDQVGKNMGLGQIKGYKDALEGYDFSQMSRDAVRQANQAVLQMQSDYVPPSAVIGNDGQNPAMLIDYKRMGREMGTAMEKTGVYMDGKSVGGIVSEPVNDSLGSSTQQEGRGTL